MNHLSPAEFIDAVDGTLPASRAAHLDGCARCGEQAAVVRSALTSARVPEMPEPSPLYWDHLTANIRARVAVEPPPAESWWHVAGIRRMVPVASVAALAGAVVASGLMMGERVAAPIVVAPSAVVAAADTVAPPEDSEVWQMLTSVAADTPIEDAHAAGMAVGAGAIDRAVQRMSPEELTALGQLLQSEMRGSGE